ncbi:MAG: hypothetical protein IH953_02045 [Chloroflexi bacterium]|nr:hypothetical protein [Chloroflexota bacterium]
MELQARQMRRSLIWVTLMAIAILAYRVFDPYRDTSLFIRLAMVVAASVLAAGLIPGSYIHRFIDILLDRPNLGSPKIISVTAVAGPLLVVGVSAFGVYDQIFILTNLIEEFGLTFLDPHEARFNAAWYAAIGILSVIFLLSNLLDIVRATASARTT